MTRIGDGGGSNVRMPQQPIEAQKTEAKTIDESTTPAAKAAEKEKSVENIEDIQAKDRPVISEESKAFGRAAMTNNVGATALKAKAEGLDNVQQGEKAVHICGPGCNHGGTADVHAHGANSASNVGAPPGPRPSTSQFKSVDEAKKAIERDFPGVKVDTTSGKKWTCEELERVHQHLSTMGPKEKEALNGVTIKREAEAKGDEAGAGGGTTAGVFRPNVDVDEKGVRKKGPEIVFFDASMPDNSPKKPDTKGMKPAEAKAANDKYDKDLKAYENDKVFKDADGTMRTAKEQDLRTSQHVILHESGHAVEGKQAADVLADSNGKATKLNNALAKEGDWDKGTGPIGDYKTAIGGVKKELKDLNKTKDGQDYLKYANQANTALNNMQSATDDKALAKAKADYDAAATKRDAALAKLEADPKASSGAQSAARAHRDAQDTLAPLRKDYGDAHVAHAKTEADVKKAYAKLDDPKTPNVNELQTKNQAGFEKKVTKNISDYGATAKTENYAEAYAMYKRDPKWLEKNNKAAFDYFEKALKP